LADAPDPELCAEYKKDLEKAETTAETSKNKKESAAKEMSQFYANLLSLDAKYAWNKIIKEQMETDPYMDLQGVYRNGPRELSHESFNNCIIFHLLTVFPNNAAEQEKYCLSNMLKKPQQVGVHQFVQRVEQLNAYFAQLPCWYYRLSYNLGMTPANVPFTEADLASHVLRMYLHQWQDQYNLHEKGMAPVDMCLLLTCQEAIECVCTQKKPTPHPARELLRRTRQEPSGPVLTLQSRFPRKSVSRRIATCATSMGECTPHTISRIVVGTRKTEW
jgi:hypothetical protein